MDGPSQLRVLLGVTGGIAAYKATDLIRRLKGRGHAVRCAVSQAATAFIPPLTLEVLSGSKVYQEEYLDRQGTGTGEELHITAAQWAGVLCIAPATANTLGRLAQGLADDFLTTTALAFPGPLVLAPAMHAVMWEHPAVRANVETLTRRGVRFVGPVEGPLASGEVGMGRLAETAAIVAAIEGSWGMGRLFGRTVVITAGPTQEPVDPVRYLGNRSSGKMGFALADQAARWGARVVLISGPVALPTPPGVVRHDVKTAREMEAAVHAEAPAADLIIMTAAVADFRPVAPAEQKIKKSQGLERVELTPNPDILASLPRIAPDAVRVGFAAETQSLEENACAKLERKGAHFIVANDVSRGDIGFGSEANEVTVYGRGREPVAFSRRPKEEVAAALLHLFAEALESREPVLSPA
jgi:phosphopantothenoylcysteine decarboxylase/phosphopantothenate--cysteine ligase